MQNEKDCRTCAAAPGSLGSLLLVELPSKRFDSKRMRALDIAQEDGCIITCTSGCEENCVCGQRTCEVAQWPLCVV